MNTKLSAELTPDQSKRADDIAIVKDQITPLREIETCSIRPCYNDVVLSYKKIDGVGKPDDMFIYGNQLWEDDALTQWQALQDAMEIFRQYFEAYSFPENPNAEKPLNPAEMRVIK